MKKLLTIIALLLSLNAFSQKAVNGVVNLKDWGIAAHTGAVSGIYKPSEDLNLKDAWNPAQDLAT